MVGGPDLPPSAPLFSRTVRVPMNPKDLSQIALRRQQFDQQLERGDGDAAEAAADRLSDIIHDNVVNPPYIPGKPPPKKAGIAEGDDKGAVHDGQQHPVPVTPPPVGTPNATAEGDDKGAVKDRGGGGATAEGDDKGATKEPQLSDVNPWVKETPREAPQPAPPAVVPPPPAPDLPPPPAPPYQPVSVKEEPKPAPPTPPTYQGGRLPPAWMLTGGLPPGWSSSTPNRRGAQEAPPAGSQKDVSGEALPPLPPPLPMDAPAKPSQVPPATPTPSPQPAQGKDGPYVPGDLIETNQLVDAALASPKTPDWMAQIKRYLSQAVTAANTNVFTRLQQDPRELLALAAMLSGGDASYATPLPYDAQLGRMPQRLGLLQLNELMGPGLRTRAPQRIKALAQQLGPWPDKPWTQDAAKAILTDWPTQLLYALTLLGDLADTIPLGIIGPGTTPLNYLAMPNTTSYDIIDACNMHAVKRNTSPFGMLLCAWWMDTSLPHIVELFDKYGTEFSDYAKAYARMPTPDQPVLASPLLALAVGKPQSKAVTTPSASGPRQLSALHSIMGGK